MCNSRYQQSNQPIRPFSKWLSEADSSTFSQVDSPININLLYYLTDLHIYIIVLSWVLYKTWKLELQKTKYGLSRYSISSFYSCDKSSYIRSVYSQCHVDLSKCTEQNINNQSHNFMFMFPFVLRWRRIVNVVKVCMNFMFTFSFVLR